MNIAELVRYTNIGPCLLLEAEWDVGSCEAQIVGAMSMLLYVAYYDPCKYVILSVTTALRRLQILLIYLYVCRQNIALASSC